MAAIIPLAIHSTLKFRSSIQVFVQLAATVDIAGSRQQAICPIRHSPIHTPFILMTFSSVLDCVYCRPLVVGYYYIIIAQHYVNYLNQTNKFPITSIAPLPRRSVNVELTHTHTHTRTPAKRQRHEIAWQGTFIHPPAKRNQSTKLLTSCDYCGCDLRMYFRLWIAWQCIRYFFFLSCPQFRFYADGFVGVTFRTMKTMTTRTTTPK